MTISGIAYHKKFFCSIFESVKFNSRCARNNLTFTPQAHKTLALFIVFDYFPKKKKKYITIYMFLRQGIHILI